jgi:DNA-directed RNA polymerase subunit beta'
VGRLISAGTGLAYHAERKRKRQTRDNDRMKAMPETLTVSAEDMEAKLSEAFSDK